MNQQVCYANIRQAKSLLRQIAFVWVLNQFMIGLTPPGSTVSSLKPCFGGLSWSFTHQNGYLTYTGNQYSLITISNIYTWSWMIWFTSYQGHREWVVTQQNAVKPCQTLDSATIHGYHPPSSRCRASPAQRCCRDPSRAADGPAPNSSRTTCG